MTVKVTTGILLASETYMEVPKKAVPSKNKTENSPKRRKPFDQHDHFSLQPACTCGSHCTEGDIHKSLMPHRKIKERKRSTADLNYLPFYLFYLGQINSFLFKQNRFLVYLIKSPEREPVLSLYSQYLVQCLHITGIQHRFV